ncbi:PVC-type heme-binding CxxCH protein [Pleomorphovibrio marinus]|uniref:PVC-type heme-binding CxxCH protein n=1 Tax=Pleomorphovibrio marinus TaxID=2164132 RepID=UPI000E0C1596|nr:PVC-type heme-binding CxxCH protein [Pleomorphovibrio marinus]
MTYFIKAFRQFCGFLIILLISSCGNGNTEETQGEPTGISTLKLEQDEATGSIQVFRQNGKEALLTQEAKEDFRPYIHPILSPDGKGYATEYSPGHHLHQTGLYWGFTNVNGRDFFHHPEGSYWKRVAVNTIEKEGEEVTWQTLYHLLDEDGEPMMLETQNWSMVEKDGKYFLDLEWKGVALQNITIGKYDYGGLFLRMPWEESIDGEVVNAARQRNDKAEGQAAMWVNVGMQVEGREDYLNVAIFDHPENKGYPQKWRVDGQLGVGPAFTRGSDWGIEKGEILNLKHRLLVYTGKRDDMELNAAWNQFGEGKGSTTALWRIAQQEGRQAKFLNPEEAVDAMTLKDGFNVNVFASEPMITQPMAFCWDDKGRLWVAENKDYESRGHGFSSAGNSRILILEDTNGDGKADTSKVFLEGLAFPAAMAVGFDGLYLGAPPNLLFVPDRDGDDRADVDEIEILLTGWGIRDRHETLNSLHWGPDGWLYGLQGFATPSKIRKPGPDTKLYYHNDPFPEDLLEGDGVDINGGVWRFHPTKKDFEVVAHGFSNPWGIDYDHKGQLFITACVIPHLWHVIPGGIYHRQGGQHFNPYVYEDIKTIADHRHRSAHGGARIYQSDAFPKEEYGRIFMANIHEHAVLSDILVKEGSGYIGKDGDEFMMANNAQWVGFSMEIGPDGGLYVLDWHDADICGQEVLNEETGRVFRIMPENSSAKNWEGRFSDLNNFTDLELVNLQTNESDWHARRARGILQKRAVNSTMKKNALDRLQEIYRNDENPDWRLRAMWALHITGNMDATSMLKATEDKDEYIRSWAIQFLCEDKPTPPKALERFAQMARSDQSAVVRLYLAQSLQRIPQNAQWDIANHLVTKSEDAEDHNLPKMIWFGIENLIKKDTQKFMDLTLRAEIPLLANFMARRAVDADEFERLVTAIEKSSINQKWLLEGMLSGMEGRTDLKVPSNWSRLSKQLQNNPKTAELSQQIAELFGDAEATQRSLSILKDQNASVEDRKKALRALSAQQRKELADYLPSLLDEKALRKPAIRSVASFDQESLGKVLIERYEEWDAEERFEVVQTLSSRPRFGNMLAQEIKANKIPKREIPANVARQLLRVVGSGFIEIWGPIEQVAHDEEAYEKYRGMLTENALAEANLLEGKQLFSRTCGGCHKMFGEGSDLGPDLTGSNRTDVDYILLNVLEPSAEIQDDYRMVVISTRDGRTYTGNVVNENQRQLVLRVVGQDPVVINKSSIQSREVTDVSMMPPGLFEHMKEKEIVNLVAYLKSPKAVN